MFCFELPGGQGVKRVSVKGGTFLPPSAQCGFFLARGLLSRQGHKEGTLGVRTLGTVRAWLLLRGSGAAGCGGAAVGPGGRGRWVARRAWSQHQVSSLSHPSCLARVTGELTMTFPAGIVRVFSGTPPPPVLSFRLVHASAIEHFQPNADLLFRYWRSGARSEEGVPEAGEVRELPASEFQLCLPICAVQLWANHSPFLISLYSSSSLPPPHNPRWGWGQVGMLYWAQGEPGSPPLGSPWPRSDAGGTWVSQWLG